MMRENPPFPTYPEWDARQRGAAQRILNNALDVLDEYDY